MGKIITKYLFSLLLFILMSLFSPADAESITLDLADGGGSFSGRLIQLFLVFTILSVAPSLVIMVTSFTRFVVVLSFLRTAIGLQQSPPNMVLLSLAMFLTFFVMSPTFEQAYEEGIAPLVAEKLTEEQALVKAAAPFHAFMRKNVKEKDLELFLEMRGGEKIEKPEDIPFTVLIPSFMISELKRAFEIGFLIFIPFLILDLIIAAVLMSMGMMMLPPALVSLPFKIIFFILIDGWHLLCGSLVNSVIPT